MDINVYYDISIKEISMGKTQDIILQGLKDAMMAERTGIEFYTMASRTTQDSKGREVFQLLAQEEQQHFDYLQKTYGQLLNGEAMDSKLPLASESTLLGKGHIFSDSLRNRLQEAHFEMSALSVGLQLEQNAIKHYQSLADVAGDPKVKEFFLQLVQWETNHARAFINEMNSLKEDYWSQANFAPF
jgi:rubrerythrin